MFSLVDKYISTTLSSSCHRNEISTNKLRLWIILVELAVGIKSYCIPFRPCDPVDPVAPVTPWSPFPPNTPFTPERPLVPVAPINMKTVILIYSLVKPGKIISHSLSGKKYTRFTSFP